MGKIPPMNALLGETSIQYVKGVGPARKKLFNNLGIFSVEDMLYFFPRRYEDRRNIIPLANVAVNEMQTVAGRITTGAGHRSWYTKKYLTQIIIEDETGKLLCVWFNQPYLTNYFKEGKHIVCYGRTALYKGQLQMTSPEYEIISDGDQENLNINRIVPIYSLTRGITQRTLRKTMKACLDRYREGMDDELPVGIRNKYKLYNIKRSLMNVHFPQNMSDQEKSLERISFEEFYFFQISILLRRLSVTRKQGIAHKITDAFVLNYVDAFGFSLTGAQKRVIREIIDDMREEKPMLRLLQGDVGCGKTLAALSGALAAVADGHQACFMAPTEILARQHYENINKTLKSEAFRKYPVNTALFVSGMKASVKEDILKQVGTGDVNLVIGTHALINEDVSFKSLSFCVIDEQHKFGVRQRALLSKKGSHPDVLIMTATPIPRTLYITLFGDLDVSIIDEMPAGRGPIRTKLFAPERIDQAVDFLKSKISKGQQAYIVYPIINESEHLDLKAAENMYKRFSKHELKDYRVGLITGRMRQAEAETVMQSFKEGEIDVLVATTVLEVGIDVPNATVMLIEHAERFGLAQLHQLRGRIGRGEKESFCLLIADPETEDAHQRIDAVLSTTDGFKIAQRDLQIRGPGQYFGRHQHGLSELKVANPALQLNILELARKEALSLIKEDPDLKTDGHPRIKEIIRKRYPTYLADVKAG